MEIIKNLPVNSEQSDTFFINILETIFKDCPDGMIFKDKDLRYICANQAFYNCYKLTNKNNFIGKKECDFLSIENKKLINNVTKSILKEQRAVNFIMSWYDGTDKIHSVTSSPIFWNNNFMGIISVIRDITQEENMKERFVFKHSQLKSLLENIPMIIYMLDTNLNYIAGTKPSKDFVKNGYDAFSNLHIDKAKSRKEEIEEYNDVIKNNKILIKEKEVLDYSQRPHWYKIYKVPINNRDGEVNSVITLANNIDAEKQLQSQRETFVASIGHDLKNPTIAQIRSLELLLNGSFGEVPTAQKEILEMVLDSCRYMNGMLASLLATYRNYGGIVKLNFENFSLPNLVNECVGEMIYVAKDKNVDITVENTFIEDCVNADRVQIKRVIMNFLSNGIKYAFSNSKLKLFIYSERKNACFKFENESPYIPEEKQKAIFDQYVSYASAYNELGIGLGLYASKKIIDGHSGKIYVKSYLNNRNCFGFKIPITQSCTDEDRVICF